MNSLRELYVHELEDLYDAEQQITQALPKMAEAASSGDLKAAFQEHLRQTESHVRRLEQIFQQMGGSPQGTKCKGLAGLLAEGKELINMGGDAETKDAGLIGAAQKVEHYEISGYGTARTWARLLGERQAAELLQATLEEEAKTDEKLTRLAEAHINREAAAGQARKAA